ncbi:Pyruvate dehydrogenase E1 component subunit beta-1, mitochondrial [Capsicum chinense]|nr:Pyruvate dehydrogenase E1 component subunit beta-1, mitochondrial [Capsicum chinense]
MDARSLMSLMAIDHIINSTAKSNYMSAGQISVPIIFKGPNDAAARVGAQHSQGLTYPVAELFLEDVFEKKIRNLRLAAILRKSHAAHCIVLRPVQLYMFQIARREGLSLWQELFPTLVSVSNKGPAQLNRGDE